MRAVVQRCHQASVEVDGIQAGSISHGLAIFLGIAADDDESHARKMASKISSLRIFNDENGKFSLSVCDVAGAALVISNFTVYADTSKGNRPNFIKAARPDTASLLYERFVTLLRECNLHVETGVFAASMRVLVENDGPVTVVIDID